jgi:hypothetical protein
MILAYVSGLSLESFMCEGRSGGILLIGTRKNSCAFWEREAGRMTSRYATVAIAKLLLIGCANTPPQDSGGRACWLGTWIACK